MSDILLNLLYNCKCGDVHCRQQLAIHAFDNNSMEITLHTPYGYGSFICPINLLKEIHMKIIAVIEENDC